MLGGLSLCQNVKVPFVLLPPSIPDDPDPYPSPKGEASQGGVNTTDAVTPASTELVPRRAEIEESSQSHLQHQLSLEASISPVLKERH